MESGVEKFRRINESVINKEIEPSVGEEQVKDINFNEFSINEIDVVENCEWLSPTFIVDVLREWIDMQNQNINESEAYLLFNPVIDKSVLESIRISLGTPSKSSNFRIENVIETLAKSNQSKDYVNPVDSHLITVSSSPTSPKNELSNIYSEDPKNSVFLALPNSNNFACVGLPPFLAANISSYKIRRGDKQWPVSWTLEGSNDQVEWIMLDSQDGNESLKDNQEVVFNVEEKGYFRYFKLSQKKKNSHNNLHMQFTGFDISGKVRFVEEK